MRHTMIQATYGRKWNLGDYESLHIELSAWAELEEGEAIGTATAALFAEMKEAVRFQALPVLQPKHKPRVTHTIAGVPVVAADAVVVDEDGVPVNEEDV